MSKSIHELEMNEDLEINAATVLSTASELWSSFHNDDVRLGITILAAALMLPDVTCFMGDDPIVVLTARAISQTVGEQL